MCLVNLCDSIIDLRDFVVKGSLDAERVILPELLESRQLLNTIKVALQGRVSLIKLTLTDESHKVAEFEKDEVDVGDVGAA